jgi:hypothetical protein
MRRAGRIAIGLAVALAAAPAWAQGDDEDEDEDDVEERDVDASDEDDDSDEDDGGGGMRANRDDDDRDRDSDRGDDDEDFEEISHESDHGRPGGGNSTSSGDANSFEQSRFYIDKLDTAKTAKGTLFQGSLTSSTFYYRESGGELAGATGSGVRSNSEFARAFTDLRGQLDALHLAGGRWDMRLDVRGRAIGDPDQNTLSARGLTYPTRVQGGTYGRNELELRELWLVRGGVRTDLFVGRQFVADLGAIKIDGLRFDYAKSNRLTILGFAGAYPMRGSRTIGTDYLVGRDEDGVKVGRVIPLAFGGGGAYRTEHMYGSFGGVAILPFKGETPRVYATSSGYWRKGTRIDLYHFAIIDLYGEAADPIALTNVSAGVNFKPAARMRITGSFHRVDTETLNVTAQAFLNGDEVTNVVRSDIEVQRIASDQVRGGLSVSLGGQQQIEVSTALAVRQRPAIPLYDGINNDPVQTLPGSRSVEVWFGAVHRNLKGYRVGVDASRIFGAGGGGIYARSASFGGRLYASKEFRGGRGEWELDLGYTSSKDDNVGMLCTTTDVESCYGSSKIGFIELGGTMYYRIKKDIFGVAMLNIGRYSLQTATPMGVLTDPSVLSTSGYLRIGYRF